MYASSKVYPAIKDQQFLADLIESHVVVAKVHEKYELDEVGSP